MHIVVIKFFLASDNWVDSWVIGTKLKEVFFCTLLYKLETVMCKYLFLNGCFFFLQKLQNLNDFLFIPLNSDN